MSIAFHRTDITQTSQAERGTMCVLPLSKGKRQNKIVLGDCDGVIQALGMRKKEEERNSVFKTNPARTPSLASPSAPPPSRATRSSPAPAMRSAA